MERTVIHKSVFRLLQDVMITLNGVDYYGWVDKITFHDVNYEADEYCETYNLTIVLEWEGEPLKSEHKSFLYPQEVDPEDNPFNLRKSDSAKTV